MPEAQALKQEQLTSPPRPLNVLVKLIKADLDHGRDAARQAGLPYYRAAGEKLLEAKAQLPHGEFSVWVRRHFGIGKDQWVRYMALAEHGSEKSLTSDFSSLSDFIRKTSNPNYNNRTVPPRWQAPVNDVVNRVDVDTLPRDDLRRREERVAERKLGLQLIDIGFKVLAKTLHPDSGGSREAMQRLNAVRSRLRQHV